jgi:hypothetical protein
MSERGNEGDEPGEARPAEPAPEAAEPAPEAAEPAEPPRRGSVSFQDPATTRPREPTLAEARARELKRRADARAEAAHWEAVEREAKKRKRILVGGVAVVGVAAVVGLGYAAARPDDTVTARCVGPDNVVVPDSNCGTPAPAGSYHAGGIVPFPIFIGSGGRQYHYTYGGSGGIGQVATGGTTVPPRGTTVRTPSGRTLETPGSHRSSSISRGGFGVGGARHGSAGG